MTSQYAIVCILKLANFQLSPVPDFTYTPSLLYIGIIWSRIKKFLGLRPGIGTGIDMVVLL